MAEPVEKWGPGQKSLRYVVELEGAVVTKTLVSSMGTTTRTYQVDRVEVTTRWELGREEEGRTTVKLDCREILAGFIFPRAVVFYPDDLDEVPPWLTDLETRASPRDVG